MRVTINPTDLQAALEIASRAVGKATTQPVLASVLVEATPDGGVTITGTDLRTRAYRTVDALVEEAGAVILPPAAIAGFLDAVAPDAPISMVVDGSHKAVLSSGRTTSRIAGLDADQFPAAPDLDEWAAEISLWPDALRTLVESVAFAASGDEARPALSGIHLSITQPGAFVVSEHGETKACLTMTAADGLRLARRTMALEWPQPDISLIVPADRLAKAAAGLKDAKGEVRLAFDSRGRWLVLDAETGTWAITLIEGTYPAVDKMLLQEPRTTVTVARSDLLRACRLVVGLLVDIVSTDGKSIQKAGKAVLEIGVDSLTIRAGDSNADHEAVTVIDAAVEPASGDSGPLVTALNSAALRDAAQAFEGAAGIAIELCGPGKSVFLRAAGGDRRQCLQMIQPLAVSNTDQRGA